VWPLTLRGELVNLDDDELLLGTDSDIYHIAYKVNIAKLMLENLTNINDPNYNLAELLYAITPDIVYPRMLWLI